MHSTKSTIHLSPVLDPLFKGPISISTTILQGLNLGFEGNALLKPDLIFSNEIVTLILEPIKLFQSTFKGP
jgi:hypothetical protein